MYSDEDVPLEDMRNLHVNGHHENGGGYMVSGSSGDNEMSAVLKETLKQNTDLMQEMKAENSELKAQNEALLATIEGMRSAEKGMQIQIKTLTETMSLLERRFCTVEDKVKDILQTKK